MEAITPFITSAELSSAANVDIFDHQHAIIETVCADLVDSPVAHLPSGNFGVNSAGALKVNHRIAVIPVATRSR